MEDKAFTIGSVVRLRSDRFVRMTVYKKHWFGRISAIYIKDNGEVIKLINFSKAAFKIVSD